VSPTLIGTPYKTARGLRGARVVSILQFPAFVNRRYIDRPDYYDRLSSSLPTPDTGLTVASGASARLNLLSGELEFDDVEVAIADPSDAFGAFLAANDASLRRTKVLLLTGFMDVPEDEFKTAAYYLHDWRRDPAGLYRLTLRTALSFLARPLFETFKADSLQATVDFYAGGVAEIPVSGDVTKVGLDWPTSGYVLLHDQQTREVRLVAYNATKRGGVSSSTLVIGGGDTPSNPSFSLGVGKSRLWLADRTEVLRAWAYLSSPIALFLRLATTTKVAGSNGPDDVGDGNGLGDLVPYASIDRAGMLAQQPRFGTTGGVARNGLFIGTRSIDSLLDYFSQSFLACGLYFAVTSAGLLTLRRVATIGNKASIDLTPVVDLDEREGIEFVRGLNVAANVVRWQYDHHPATDEFLSSKEVIDGRSQARFGKSDVAEIHGFGLRGLRGLGYGFPDLGWDRFVGRRRWEFITEFANPSEPIDVPCKPGAAGAEIGSLVKLTNRSYFDLAAGKPGVTDAMFYVIGMNEGGADDPVKLALRQRRHIGRPAYLGPEPAPEWTAVYRVNFGPLTSEGYRDTDAVVWDLVPRTLLYPAAGYGLDRTGTLGWVTTSPAEEFDRDNAASPDERYDTGASQQNGPSNERVFRLSVTPDLYRVTVVMGDPNFAQQQNLSVNGTPLLSVVTTPANSYQTVQTIVDAFAGKIEIAIAKGTGSNSTLCWAEVERLAPPAGYSDLYLLNAGPPYGSGYEDEPDYSNLGLADLWPVKGRSTKEAGALGWLDNFGLNFSNEHVGGFSPNPAERFDSYLTIGNTLAAKTLRLKVRRGNYLVVLTCGRGAGASTISASVNGTTYWRDVALAAGVFVSDGRIINAPVGLLEIKLGGGTVSGSCALCSVRVLGRGTKTIRRLNITTVTPGTFQPGYREVKPATSYSAGQGYGWVVGPGSNVRERNDPGLLAAGKKWDTFAFAVNGGTQLNHRIDLPNGWYEVSAGAADTLPTTNVRVTANGVKVLDLASISAGVLNTGSAFVQVTAGTLTILIGHPSVGGNSIVNWVRVRQAQYYASDAAARQFAHWGPRIEVPGLFADGTPQYDMGV